MLDLCSGAGYLGLIVAHRTHRRAVLVDREPAACRWAKENAARAGLVDQVEVRCAPLEHAVAANERFSIVIADPPYIPTAEVAHYGEDPPSGIDGGVDGLTVARRCVSLIAACLSDAGSALIQLRTTGQARELVSGLPSGLRCARIASFEHGTLVRLTPVGCEADATDEPWLPAVGG